MLREAYGGARAFGAMSGGTTPTPSVLSPGIGGAVSTNEPVRKATDEQILDPVQRQIQRTTGFSFGAF
jgi:hypothetical protein